MLLPFLNATGTAENCGTTATGGMALEVTANCHGAGGSGSPTTNSPDPYEAYDAKPLCVVSGLAGGPGESLCANDPNCPEGTITYLIYGLKDGNWHLVREECRADTATPTITPALVSHAFQQIPLPHLRTIAQPGTKTLVNFDTIFYVEAEPLQRHLTLLNQRVELDISPSSFHWAWGDGQTDTTHTPGAPYPSKTVIHRYLDADTTVSARVTVTWTARWRVNGGTWADVPGSVQTTGPAATLRVVEAVPNLSGPD